MKHRTLDENQVVALLWLALEQEPTQTALAAKIGVTTPFLHDVLMKKRAPTGKILEYLGVERITIYRQESTKE